MEITLTRPVQTVDLHIALTQEEAKQLRNTIGGAMIITKNQHLIVQGRFPPNTNGVALVFRLLDKLKEI